MVAYRKRIFSIHLKLKGDHSVSKREIDSALSPCMDVRLSPQVRLEWWSAFSYKSSTFQHERKKKKVCLVLLWVLSGVAAWNQFQYFLILKKNKQTKTTTKKTKQQSPWSCCLRSAEAKGWELGTEGKEILKQVIFNFSLALIDTVISPDFLLFSLITLTSWFLVLLSSC